MSSAYNRSAVDAGVVCVADDTTVDAADHVNATADKLYALLTGLIR